MAIGGIGRLLKKLRRSRSGAAAVEFALLMLFIILPLFFALFEMSPALQQHHIFLKGVRDAARYAARLPDHDAATPFEATVCAESTGDAQAIKNLAMYGTLTSAGLAPLLPLWTEYDTLCSDGPTAADDFTTAGGEAMTGRLYVRVRATIPYQDLGLLSLLGIPDFNLTAQHEEPYIGE